MAAPSEVSLATLSLIELSIPQLAFRSAIGERLNRRALLVRWTDRDGCWGLGECSCRPDPFFNGEFVDGAYDVIRDFVFPLLPARCSIADLASLLRRFRGWNFTVATVLEAACDLLRRKGLPDPLLDAGPPLVERVPVGISLGLFDGASEAVERVTLAVEQGYQRVKMKVAPSMNLEPLRAVRSEFPDLHLGFDANGSCGEGDRDFVRQLVELRPSCLEQPSSPDRLDLSRALHREFADLRICLDESVSAVGDLIAAHRLEALDEVNIKPGRVGGQIAVVEILEYCASNGIPAWVGGMFETSVGRVANLRVAARLIGAAGHDLSPPSAYLAEDVAREPLRMSADGFYEVGEESPVEVDEDAIDRLHVRKLDLEHSGEPRGS